MQHHSGARNSAGIPTSWVGIAIVLVGIVFAGSFLAGKAIRTAIAAPAMSPLVRDAQVIDDIRYVTADQALQRTGEHAPLFIDLRTPDEFDVVHIEGAINIPESELLAALPTLPHDRPLVVYCTCPDDRISIRAAEVLQNRGLNNVVVLKYGLAAWEQTGGAIFTDGSADALANLGCGCSVKAEAIKLWAIEQSE